MTMEDRRTVEMRQRLEDQIEQVTADLGDVDRQEVAGELPPADAERLRTTYRNEHTRLETELAALTDPEGEDEPPRDRRRLVAGVVVVLLGFAAVTAVLLGTVRPRQPGELATGGIAGDVVSGNIDLSEVTNEEMEAVIAENPDVVGMRLALARRYFEAGEFDRALPHYMVILEGQDPDNAEALASVGWMTHLSGRSDVAAGFVERALAIAPDYAQANWFLANIRYHGLDDPEAATEPLERLLTSDGVPDQVRDEAQALLDTINEGSS